MMAGTRRPVSVAILGTAMASFMPAAAQEAPAAPTTPAPQAAPPPLTPQTPAAAAPASQAAPPPSTGASPMVPPEPAPSTGEEPQSDSTRPSQPALSKLPYYTPTAGEAAQPPRPDPPKGLSLGLGLKTYFLPDSVGGGVDSSLQFAIGGAVAAGGLSYLASSGLFGVNIELPHSIGIPIASAGPGRIAILTPAIHAEVFVFGGERSNVFMNLGGSAIGVHYSSCRGPLPWFVQARGPSFTGWLPASAAGAGLGTQGVHAFTSYGLSVEAGVLLF